MDFNKEFDAFPFVKQTVKFGNQMEAYERQLRDANQRAESLMSKLEEREHRVKQLEGVHAELSRQASRERVNAQQVQMRSVSREDLEQIRAQLEMATRDAQAMQKRLMEREERVHFLENECVSVFLFRILLM